MIKGVRMVKLGFCQISILEPGVLVLLRITYHVEIH